MNEDEWDFENPTNNQIFSTAKSQKIRPPNFSQKSSLVEIPSYNQIIDSETPHKKKRNEPNESTNYYNLGVPTEKSLRNTTFERSYQADAKLYNNNFDKEQFNKIKEMFDIRNNNTINKLKATLKDADNQNHNLKFAKVLADIQKSKVLKPVRSVINNIENANIPFFTTNNSNINDSISKTSAGFPRIESAMSVKVPFYTGSKINEPEI